MLNLSNNVIKKQRGISLIDLLFGISVGTLMTAGLILFFVNLSSTSTTLISTARLEHELQTAMALMKHDIRRAGYNSNAGNLIGSGTENPFTVTGSSDINLPTSQCILFSYDYNKTGTLPTLNSGSHDDRFAYRLSESTIQSRAASDPYFNCSAGQWYNLTDPNLIKINNLKFELISTNEPLDPASASGSYIMVRTVSIALTGALISDPSIEKTITSQVRIRNDKYVL